MAVVIRLQGLEVTAGSEEIRKFFTGLKIPDGGVHIFGGELEEAFIIFASDEDARRAMTRSGGFIRGSPVTLLLSSKAEMQNVLEITTQNVELEQKRLSEDMDPEVGRTSSGRSGYSPPFQHHRASKTEDFFGLFLNGLPFSVTEEEIRDFFGGIQVTEIVIVKNHKGQNNGKGFVNFSTREDSLEALKRDREYIGSRYIEVLETTTKDWYRATGRMPMMVNMGDNFERGRSPVHSQRNPQHYSRSRSPVTQRHIAPSGEEYCVMLDNLSFAAEKRDIKQLFHNAKLENDQILHLIDKNGKRMRSAFVLFKSLHDYREALSQRERLFFNRQVYIRPISRENMISLLESQSSIDEPPGNPKRSPERPPSYPRDDFNSEKLCVFVRNLPFDVRKVEIIDFFHGFDITEDKVWVLHDHKGAGVGQALVLFGSEEEAMGALSLNGRRFLGSEVVMKCISRFQMKQLAAETPVMQEPLPRGERYSGRRSRSRESSSRPGETFYSDLRNLKDGNVPSTYAQGPFHGGDDMAAQRSSRNRDNGVRGSVGSFNQYFDGPTCVQLVNLPFQIRSQEIYDFCYGYRIIPGSVSLQHDQSGKPKGSATLVFESRQEALNAIRELNGRPIGPRKIQLILV
ncbi:RNA binding motif protein 12Bb [Melanotaenia boesemani]|uniref:RNA binding motif protein 12Bb n=1 Tax=Melanotaenia boesemani TaxID=1250792 RepID=UPI001C04E228|nr:RNA binding motif protein 12Bb [Melanotaenia boesemani]XP_041845205.1 RNA binding motif protein 12Bb [Melanotaenia boesemani]